MKVAITASPIVSHHRAILGRADLKQRAWKLRTHQIECGEIPTAGTAR